MLNTATATTKPCQNCGEPIAVGIIACASCQREWMIAFRKSHAWLFEGRNTAY